MIRLPHWWCTLIARKEKSTSCILSQKGKMFFSLPTAKYSLNFKNFPHRKYFCYLKNVKFIKYGWYNILKRKMSDIKDILIIVKMRNINESVLIYKCESIFLINRIRNGQIFILALTWFFKTHTLLN